MLTRPSQFGQIQQNRKFVFEARVTAVFIGLYHLASEKSSLQAQNRTMNSHMNVALINW